MSTYYYIVCDKHMEITDAASRSGGDIGGPLAESEHTLHPFIVAHSDCPVRILSEHHPDVESHTFYKFTEWTRQNAEEMFNKNLMLKEK